MHHTIGCRVLLENLVQHENARKVTGVGHGGWWHCILPSPVAQGFETSDRTGLDEPKPQCISLSFFFMYILIPATQTPRSDPLISWEVKGTSWKGSCGDADCRAQAVRLFGLVGGDGSVLGSAWYVIG